MAAVGVIVGAMGALTTAYGATQEFRLCRQTVAVRRWSASRLLRSRA